VTTTRIIGIDDSKKLDPSAREALAEEIKQKAAAWCVAFVEVEEIDSINIYWAGLLAMRRALEGLQSTPQHLLIDAKRLKEVAIPQQAIIKGDAKSASTVLAPTGMQDGTTAFTAGVFMEVFFPVKVSRVGFFLNPSLDNVSMIALDTNFAFSGLPETNLETGNGAAGNFVGFSRPTADIGGLKIFAAGAKGFSLDDLTLGGAVTTPIPEPTIWMMLLGGLASLAALRRRRA